MPMDEREFRGDTPRNRVRDLNAGQVTLDPKPLIIVGFIERLLGQVSMLESLIDELKGPNSPPSAKEATIPGNFAAVWNSLPDYIGQAADRIANAREQLRNLIL